MVRSVTIPVPGSDHADIVDPDAYTSGVPHATFARLRREEPVSWWDEHDGGRGFWAVTRYDDLLKVSREKPIAEIDDQTLIMADIGAKATQQVARVCGQILRRQMDEKAAEALATTLTSGQWTHDYPIDAEEAAGLGLKVTTSMPEEVIELMQLYPQPMTTSPTVEYLPNPARPGAARPR